MNVTAVKKDVSNVNKAGPGRNALKLENETEELTHKTVNTEVKKAIMQGRLAKKLTQAQPVSYTHLTLPTTRCV